MAYEKQFLALSHPLRQHILTRLAADPLSVKDLTDGTDASQPVISQHLKVLKDAGFVDVTAKGTRNIYRANPDALAQLRLYLEQHWTAALTSLTDDKEDLK